MMMMEEKEKGIRTGTQYHHHPSQESHLLHKSLEPDINVLRWLTLDQAE